MLALMQTFGGIVDRLRSTADLSEPEVRLVETLAVIVVLLLLRWIVLFVVARQTKDARVRYHWRKGVTYALAALGIFIVARVWFSWLGSVATFFGLLSAGPCRCTARAGPGPRRLAVPDLAAAFRRG
jgi:hypothetical protein